MHVFPEHEPHEGDDYVTYDPATVCQTSFTYTQHPHPIYLCDREGVRVVDGRRTCMTHVEFPRDGMRLCCARAKLIYISRAGESTVFRVMGSVDGGVLVRNKHHGDADGFVVTSRELESGTLHSRWYACCVHGDIAGGDCGERVSRTALVRIEIVFVVCVSMMLWKIGIQQREGGGFRYGRW